MTEWLGDFAARLAAALDVEVELAPQGRDRNALLELARSVAHGTERKNAPLATYVVGRYVAARVARGDDPGDAISDALAIAGELLPEDA